MKRILFALCFAVTASFQLIAADLLTINTGTTAGDLTGDSIRIAFMKVNTNFANLSSGAIPITDPDAWAAQLQAARHVDTVADMIALSGKARTNVVVVLGRSTKGDGGGGAFYWDHSSSTVTNTGTCFAGTYGDATGRWLRATVYPVDALWFGAKGDGTTDDTTPISNAIDFAPDEGEVILQSGFTFVVDALAVPKSLIISGPGAIKHKASGSRAAVIVGDDGDTITLDGAAGGTNSVTVIFRDVTFDGNKDNQTLNTYLHYGACVYVVNGYKRAVFENCKFRDTSRTGIYAAGPIDVSGCDWTGMAQHGGVLNYTSSCIFGMPPTSNWPSNGALISVRDCTFTADDLTNTRTNNAGGIFVTVQDSTPENEFRLAVDNCEFNGTAMTAMGNHMGAIDTYNGSSDAKLTRLRFYNLGYPAIKAQRCSKLTVENCTIRGVTNTLNGDFYAILYDPQARSGPSGRTDAIIKDVTIEEYKGYGICVLGGKNVTIENVTLRNGSLGNDGTGRSMYLNGEEITVSKCSIYDPPRTAIEFTSSTNVFADNNLIWDTSETNTIAHIIVGGSIGGRVSNNRVYRAVSANGYAIQVQGSTNIVTEGNDANSPYISYESASPTFRHNKGLSLSTAGGAGSTSVQEYQNSWNVQPGAVNLQTGTDISSAASYSHTVKISNADYLLIGATNTYGVIQTFQQVPLWLQPIGNQVRIGGGGVQSRLAINTPNSTNVMALNVDYDTTLSEDGSFGLMLYHEAVGQLGFGFDDDYRYIQSKGKPLYLNPSGNEVKVGAGGLVVSGDIIADEGEFAGQVRAQNGLLAASVLSTNNITCTATTSTHFASVRNELNLTYLSGPALLMLGSASQVTNYVGLTSYLTNVIPGVVTNKYEIVNGVFTTNVTAIAW